MADIRVEKKDSSMWPWIFGIIGGLLVIWFLFTWFNKDQNKVGPVRTTEVGADTAMVGMAVLPQPVQDFSQFVKERRIDQAMGKEHEVTSEGIQKLSHAVGAVAESRNAKVEMFESSRDSMENAAKQMQQVAEASNHSNLTRASLISAAQMMEQIGSQAGIETGGAIQRFRQTAESLDSQQPLLDQREKVSNAFNQADQALHELSGVGRVTGLGTVEE